MSVNTESTIYAKPPANFLYEEALLAQELLARHGIFTDIVEAKD